MNNLALAVAFAIALMIVLGPWLVFILRSEKQNCFENTALIVLGSKQIRSRLADIRLQLESKLSNAKAASTANGADSVKISQIPRPSAQIQFLTEAETSIFRALEKANTYVVIAIPMQANGLTVSERDYLLMRSVEALKQVSKARRVLRKLEEDLSIAAEQVPVGFW
ncbi:hypothetical protein KBI23_03905 [bacterium]|nr:hypothetical protein [bacterium]MBP9809985.1 hypothetical protein [bacterium]